MIPVDFPYALAASRWEEQEKLVQRAAPKLERNGLADALKRLRRAHDAADMAAFEDEEPDDEGAIDQAVSQLQSQGQSRVRAIGSACEEVRKLAAEFERAAAAESGTPRTAVDLAKTIQRLAQSLASRWADALTEALDRARAWQTARRAQTGNLSILRRKLNEGLRAVRALAPKPGAAASDQPPKQIAFLALTKGDAARVIVGESITSNHRNLMEGLMGGGTFQPIRGTCIWEGGHYTFVSSRANASLGKLLKKAIADTTLRRLPVKARRPSTTGGRQA